MKNINLLLLFCACSFSAFAQQSVSGWYSMSEYILSPSNSYVGFLAKDSSAKLVIQNQLSNTMMLDQYIGSVYCPSDDLIDLSSNPQLKVSPNSFSRIDSIGFLYGYVRNTETNKLNNNASVVDTLIVTWFNYENLYTRKIANNTKVSLPIPSWNKYERIHTNYFAKDTLLLDASLATDVLDVSGGYENAWQTSSLYLKAPANLISNSTDHSKLFGYALQFRSGVIGGDTGYMIYQRPASMLPADAIRPNYFLYNYQSEPSENSWMEMNNTSLNLISVPGTSAYPNPQGTGFISGNMYYQKRILIDEVYISSIIPADVYGIQTLCSPDVCGASTKGSITVTVTTPGGTSPYEYSIDGANYQSSNVFSDLSAGNYTVSVRDNNMQIRVAKTKIVKLKGNESDMIKGTRTVRVGETTSYQFPGSVPNYRWFVEGGLITSSPVAFTLTVLWDNQPQIGRVGLIANYNSPCADTTILEVNVLPHVGLADNSEMNAISIYPNPSAKSIFLKGLDYKTYQVSVTDINGKQLLNQTIASTDQQEINLDELAQGCYVITLRKNDSVKHFKLIKQ